MDKQVSSKQRVVDHGEVLTGKREVNAMLDLVKQEIERIDSRFLERALTIPVDWTLYHGFYHEWMGQFDRAARSVPWQTYPGQQPCPVPATQSFPTQWEASGTYELSDRAAWPAPLADVLATLPFPEILNRNYLRYVRVRRRLGGDHGYAVAAARKVRDIWVRSDGRFEWR